MTGPDAPSRLPFVHTVAYAIGGFTLPVDRRTVDLMPESRGLRAVVTGEPDALLYDADRGSVRGNMLLTRLVGQQSELDIQEAMSAYQQERARKHGEHAVYLVLQREGMADLALAHVREAADCVLAFDAVDKSSLPGVSAGDVASAVSALALAVQPLFDATRVTDMFVFHRGDGKPVYSYTFRMFAPSAHVSPQLTADHAATAVALIPELSSDRTLSRVQRLLVASLEARRDRLRSFVDAVSALEILTDKLFPLYVAAMFPEATDDGAAAAHTRFWDRVRTVMKGKYSEAEKFAVLAVRLCPADADGDLREFVSVRAARKRLHGGDIPENQLPVDTARALTWKYIGLHVRHRHKGL